MPGWSGPGLPAGFPEPKSSRLAAIDQVAKSWLLGSVATGKLGAGEWSTQEWLRFLAGATRETPG